jgi:hypothetical protein
MNPKSYRERVYGPMLTKTFPNVLSRWLAEEFPHLGGPSARTVRDGGDAPHRSLLYPQPAPSTWSDGVVRCG